LITRRRKFLFAGAAIALSVTLTCAAVLAADLYAHHRAESSAGLNRWGYRGPLVSRKQPGEVRIVMVGGSTVFGYGGPWHEAAPAFLEQELRKARPGTPITVVNLGYNNEGAFAALPTLEDYRYLDYDIVILYQGYNDRLGDAAVNTQVYRRQSVIFRLTGYSPILPLVLQEKALVLRNGGLGKGDPKDGKPVFRPGLVARASATALETADTIGQMLDRQLSGLAPAQAGAAPAPGADCASPWHRFCESITRATAYARSLNAKVLVVAPPIHPDPGMVLAETVQHASVAAALHKRFGHDAGVRYLDLTRAVDLSDRRYSSDAMHLGRDGNLQLAQSMRPAVEQLAWPGAQ
jgi:hypothetical protein